MPKQDLNSPSTMTDREKGLLIVSSVVIVATLPITFIMFLLPLLSLPVVALAILAVMGRIRNRAMVRIIEVLGVVTALACAWLAFIILNWWAA